MASTPPAITAAASEPALWLNDRDTEHDPLLTTEDKQEPDTANAHPVIDLGPPPRRGSSRLGPIQLALDDDADSEAPAQPTRKFFNFPALPDIPAEHRSVLRDIGRGCLYILTTPIGFAAVGLYACGVIIEGVALVLKGVGSLGGSFLMTRRRNRGQQEPSTPEAWV